MYIHLYIIFFNSPKGAAEKISVISSFKDSLDIAKIERQIDSKIYDVLTSQLNDFVKYCEQKDDTDLSKPLIKVLKNQKDVSNINIYDGSQLAQDFLKKNGVIDYSDVSLYTLRWEKDNKKFDLPIIVLNPSFLKMRSAKSIVMNYELILQSYGITSEDMSKMANELKSCMMLFTMLK